MLCYDCYVVVIVLHGRSSLFSKCIAIHVCCMCVYLVDIYLYIYIICIALCVCSVVLMNCMILLNLLHYSRCSGKESASSKVTPQNIEVCWGHTAKLIASLQLLRRKVVTLSLHGTQLATFGLQIKRRSCWYGALWFSVMEVLENCDDGRFGRHLGPRAKQRTTMSTSIEMITYTF